MARKYLLVNGAWSLVSNDVLPAMRAALTGKPAGSLLFGFPSAIPLQALADQQNTVAAICQTDDEVTASKAANQIPNGFVIETRGIIWTWNGTSWVSTPLIPSLLKAYLRPRRFYYNSQSKVMWYVGSDMGMIPFLKKDNPLAAQADVAAGSGSGLVTPATLKNAYGSW